MQAKKEDRRVIRTKRDLKIAFFSLLTEKKEIKKVSVLNITERANYNRATFYMHYPDKQSLINEIIKDALEGFHDAFREPFKQVPTLDIEKLSMHSVKVFQYVESHKSTFSLLFKNDAFIGVQEKFCTALESVYLNELIFVNPIFDEINKELYIRSTSTSLIGVISYWIEHDFNHSAEFMAEQIVKIANYDSNKSRIAIQKSR